MEGKTIMRVLLLFFFILSSISSTTTESTRSDNFEYEEDIGGAFEIQGDANQNIPAMNDENLSGAKAIQSETTTEVSATISPLMTEANAVHESATTKASDVTNQGMPGGNPQILTDGEVTAINRTDDEEFAHEFYLILKPIRKAAVGFFLVCLSTFALLAVYCIVLLCKLRKIGKDELRMAEEGHADVTQENKEATGNQGSEHCLQSCCAACTTYLLSFLLKT